MFKQAPPLRGFVFATPTCLRTAESVLPHDNLHTARCICRLQIEFLRRFDWPVSACPSQTACAFVPDDARSTRQDCDRIHIVCSSCRTPPAGQACVSTPWLAARRSFGDDDWCPCFCMRASNTFFACLGAPSGKCSRAASLSYVTDHNPKCCWPLHYRSHNIPHHGPIAQRLEQRTHRKVPPRGNARTGTG